MRKLNRRQLAKGVALGTASLTISNAPVLHSGDQTERAKPSFSPWTTVAPGVWKARLGSPERFTPVGMRQHPPLIEKLSLLPKVDRPPVTDLKGSVSTRGALVSMGLAAGELVYGLGLQMYSVQQRGRKKELRVAYNPRNDCGDSHAPVPFLVTSRGLGILIDAARYITVYCGNFIPKDQFREEMARDHPDGTPDLYSPQHASSIAIEIPRSHGVEIYAFAGPNMLQAVQRYNLFSGGGCMPPEWGLGFWYRTEVSAGSQDVLGIAKELRDGRIPCDVIGLEPGWLAHLSSTYVWNRELFPDPDAFVKDMRAMDFEINLWENPFVDIRSPLFEPLKSLSGDYSVYNGLAPDFAAASARRIFADFHRKNFIEQGISGFKLDECDNYHEAGAAVPEISRFPSGLDGEQMHCLYGLHYQGAILEAFRAAKKETYGLVRNSGALAAPYPFVLYSDLYDHKAFIRALVNSGFSGLLWCPEVRGTESDEDLIRRLQSVVFSPLAMIDRFSYINLPWNEPEGRKNTAGKSRPHREELETACRKIMEWRMELILYLRSAFAEYQSAGVPPFRALVLDHQDDSRVADIDDQYLVGDRMMVAPVFAGQYSRSVVLPQGDWCDYWTGEKLGGGVTLHFNATLDRIPVYVRSGSIFPLGGIGQSTKDPKTRQVTVRLYGDGSLPWDLRAGASNWRLTWDAKTKQGRDAWSGPGKNPYVVVRWQEMD